MLYQTYYPLNQTRKNMSRLALIYLLSIVFGCLLATPGWPMPLLPGLFGAIVMLSLAWWMRSRWQHDPAAPEAPERRRLLSLGGTLVVLAHLLTSLWHIGPAMKLHTPEAHAMGIDNWVLFFAALLMGWIARAPGPATDERDRHIASSALLAGHVGLVLQLLALVIWLAFGHDALLEQLSRAMVAQLIVCFWIVSCVIQDTSGAFAYAWSRRQLLEAT